MATKVSMEALSPTMEEGKLVKWLKNEGDAVKSGEPLAEVETDKAIMELVARGDGVLRKRVLNEGDSAPVGTLVGVIAAADENVDALLGGGGAPGAKPAPQADTQGTPHDAKGLLKSAIRDDNPVCVLEGEMLYNTKGEVPDEDYVIPLGKADLKREGDHCSIITHGKMVLVAMQAADQLAKEGINVDVVDLRTIRPMDVEAIAASVNKTNRAVVLEEGWEVCGVGAQVVDYIQRECFDNLDAPVVRVHQADVPMPYTKSLEKAAKPDLPKTIAAVRKVMYLA